MVISGIQTSGGLLIRFARLFGRDDAAAAAATAPTGVVAAAEASNRLRRDTCDHFPY